ncbi:MAG: hypothetical protein IH949_10475 [Bacteroidetes bacterium]|nr:hypothetical protein [Bacteroidota bacterium]
MIIEIFFQIPIEAYVDDGPNYKEFIFDYSIKYFSDKLGNDSSSDKKVIVSIPNVLMKRWDYKSNDDLFKILFEFFVFPSIKTKLCDDNLGDVEKIALDSVKDSKKYDPKKLEYFINKSYQFDLDELCKNKNKVKMGF